MCIFYDLIITFDYNDPTVIDLIDGDKKQYENYVSNSLDELEFLEQQINLVNDAKERLLNVFKD